MKRLKLSVLMAMGFVLASAIVAANPASPTALCEINPEEGLCSKEFPAETVFEGTAKSASFSTPVGSITCSSSLKWRSKEADTPKGAELHNEILALTFSGCKLEKTECTTVKPSFMPLEASIKWIGGVNGELTPKGKEGVAESLNIFCGSLIECTYKWEAPLDVKGAAEGATVVASEETLASVSGKTCPKAGAAITWSATYTLSSPSGKFFVADYVKPVRLCKSNETPCSESETYGVSSSLDARLETGTKAKLKLTITEESEATEYTIACDSSTLEGKTTKLRVHPLSGELSALAFGECGGTCAAKALKLPYGLEIEATGSGNGTINLLTGGSGSPRLRVRCIGAYKCTYEASSISTSATGGTPAKLTVSAVLGTRVTGESDEKCGSQVQLEGKYEFTKPEAGGAPKMWIVREGI